MNSVIPSFIDYQYLEAGRHILGHGYEKPSRPGINTISSFGLHIQVDINEEGFPAIASKEFALHTMARELHWFLNGSSDNNILNEQKCHIWDQWASPTGDLGPIYGVQWREREETIRISKSDPNLSKIYDFHVNKGDGRGAYRVEETSENIFLYRNIDQIDIALKQLRNNPDDRRIIVDAWNTAVLPVPGVDPTEQASIGRQALAPCHVLFQFNSRQSEPSDFRSFYNVVSVGDLVSVNNVMTTMTLEDARNEEIFMAYVEEHSLNTVSAGHKQLDILMYQRSCDWPVGIPFNIASYALLLGYVAAATDHDVGVFNLSGGDAHIYEDQVELFEKQIESVLESDDMIDSTLQPVLVVYNVPRDLRNMDKSNYKLFNHKQGPKINYPVAK